MAWEKPVIDQPAAIAGVSFRTNSFGYQGSGQFLICKSNGVANTYVPTAAKTDRPSGIAQTKPLAGEALQMRKLGYSKVIAGAALNPGDEFGSDTHGRAVKVNPTGTGSDLGAFVLGEVIEGVNAAGQLATVWCGDPYRV
jgi:hypothetical protein